MKRNCLSAALLSIFFLSQENNSFAQGLLFGMTQEGGAIPQGGVLFSYNPATGNEQTLLNFVGDNGVMPQNGALIKGNDGLLYGMTPFGGVNGGDGVLFSFFDNAQNILLTFDMVDSPVDVGRPYFGPMQASDGLIYAVTSFGGSPSHGGIASYDPQTGESEVRFYFSETDGEFPIGTLLQASDGLLYGLTNLGGSHDQGVLYSFDPVTDQQIVLVNFLEGESANCSLIQGTDGLLYGEIQLGGINGDGFLFSYDINTGNYVKLFHFNSANGSVPNGLMQASNGLLYGLTAYGGSYGKGVLYSFDPVTNQQTVYFSFHGTKGAIPRGNLIEASDGFFYGTTSAGGDSSRGAIFQFDPVNGTVSHEFSFHDVYGEMPVGDLLEVDLATLTAKPEIHSSIVIKPVPNDGHFSVSIKDMPCKSIFITDPFGRRVYSLYFSELNTTKLLDIDLSNYPNGVYLVQLVSSKGSISRKIIIQD